MDTYVQDDIKLKYEGCIRDVRKTTKLFFKTIDVATVRDLTVSYPLSEMKAKLLGNPGTASFVYSDGPPHCPEIRHR